MPVIAIPHLLHQGVVEGLVVGVLWGLHLHHWGGRGQAVRRNGAQHYAAQDACCIVVVLRTQAASA